VIADVVFDVPIDHPFSYRVPAGMSVAPGQRVYASLRGGSRLAMVVAVRDGDAPGLKPLQRVAEPAPVVSPAALALATWIAAESLSSPGSTALSLLPPPVAADGRTPRAGGVARHGTDTPDGGAGDHDAHEPGPGAGAATCAAIGTDGAVEPLPLLLTGAGRESRMLERLSQAAAPSLVIVPDGDSAARWAQRLVKLDAVGRLDSGVSERERAAAWRGLASGDLRFAVGTRSALLAPLARGGVIAVVDEHEPLHKPPGPPRIHSRDVALARSARDALTLLLPTGTPSVEMWWRADSGRARLEAGPPGPWPAIAVADTRGIARREALTPALARAIRESLAAGRRVFLAVARLRSALGCDECGAILRCEQCALALAYSPAGRRLDCRLCGARIALPETCPHCRGPRLTPFGWGAERVEHAVRRRFSSADVVRYDPEAARGGRGEAQRKAAMGADVVIGTRGALRLFGPASLGVVGFVSLDQVLGLPDFRAAERTFALVWAAAERVRADGALILQSQNPTHYALEAVIRQDLGVFYRSELKFRAELGYPPFRRLAVLSVGGRDAGRRASTAARIADALRGEPAFAVYVLGADRRSRADRIVVKGPADLPQRLTRILADVSATPGGTKSRGIMEVEVDPVEWLF
jgi:primosomal protein N' (replication factor Y)